MLAGGGVLLVCVKVVGGVRGRESPETDLPQASAYQFQGVAQQVALQIVEVENVGMRVRRSNDFALGCAGPVLVVRALAVGRCRSPEW